MSSSLWLSPSLPGNRERHRQLRLVSSTSTTTEALSSSVERGASIFLFFFFFCGIDGMDVVGHESRLMKARLLDIEDV
jgi:hypothetical protein